MSKLEEAKEILSSLKVPAKQQNGMCCCVLLAMANLTEEQAWGSAANNWIRIHDVIAFANSNYGTTYAENSRETFRKQAMHHFRNAAFIEENFKKKISPELRSRFDYKGMFNLLTDEDKRKFVHFRVNQIISKYREFVSHDLPEKLHDNVVARIDVSNYKNMRDLNKKIKDTFVELIGS